MTCIMVHDFFTLLGDSTFRTIVPLWAYPSHYTWAFALEEIPAKPNACGFAYAFSALAESVRRFPSSCLKFSLPDTFLSHYEIGSCEVALSYTLSGLRTPTRRNTR